MALVAKFDWQMPSRVLGWIDAWDVASQSYASDYATPQEWRVILDTKGSSGDEVPIERYRWQIEGLDGNSFSVVTEDRVSTSQRTRFTKRLPQLGRYKVTLTVRNTRGEQSTPLTRTIFLQDLLVVSFGDSMASGEGNPDKSGGTVIDTDLFPADPQWTDTRCHRSRRSGHARAAQQLEWSKRSVTFLSFACSGAGILKGMLGPYDGIDSPEGRHERLHSQLEAAWTAIGNRTIDVLLLTLGLNDLGLGNAGFSSVLKTFIFSVDSGSAQDEVSNKLLLMPAKYNRVAWALSRVLHNRVKRVYLTEYPYHIFQPNVDGDREGCDLLFAIGDEEGDFLFEKGKELTRVVRDTTSLHRWNFVTGIKDLFEGHGYCDGDPWYVHLSDSLLKQENIDGTIHPTTDGHKAIAERITETVKQPVRDFTFRPRQVRVVFESIKLTVPSGTDAARSREILLSANGQEDRLPSVLFNRTVNLPTHFDHAFIVDDGLSGPQVEVSCRASFPKLNPEDPNSKAKVVEFSDKYTPSKNYGAGTHVRKVQGVELHYRIEVTDKITVRPKQVTVVFEKIRVKMPGVADNAFARRIFVGADGQTNSIGPSLLNRDITLPAQDFTFTFLADLGQLERKVVVTFGAVLPKPNPEDPDSLSRTLERSDKYGPESGFGEGERVHDDADIEVHYRVQIKDFVPTPSSPLVPLPPLPPKPTTEVRLTVKLEAIKVNFIADAFTTAEAVAFDICGVHKNIPKVALNRLVSLPADFTLPFVVDNGQQSPIVEIKVHTVLPKPSPEDPKAKKTPIDFNARFGRAQNFGVGSHTNVGAQLEVHFTITKQSGGGVIGQKL